MLSVFLVVSMCAGEKELTHQVLITPIAQFFFALMCTNTPMHPHPPNKKLFGFLKQTNKLNYKLAVLGEERESSAVVYKGRPTKYTFSPTQSEKHHSVVLSKAKLGGKSFHLL